MGEITISPLHNVHQKYRKMNLVNPYIFSVPVVAPNLYIGGVASTINTPELLAAKFQNYPSGTSFSALNIQNFSIVGSDVQCTVISDYSIKDSAFSNNSLITYYIDNLRCKEIKYSAFFSSSSTLGGIYMNIYKVHFENVIVIGRDAFNADFGTYGLKIAEFPNATTINGIRTFINNNKLEIVYIPKITSLGDYVTNDQIFQAVKNAKIYANPFLQTSNSGGVEGDLSYASSQGNIIRYIPNYTIPNSINNLSIGNIYNTAIQLNFTPPSSANAIDFYEVYLNGVYANKIYASGEFITGLSSSSTYSISIYVVDIYYNKSLISNVVSQATNTAAVLPLSSLISYYKLNSNSNDSYGSNNGVDTSVSYVSGKIGNSASYNGSTSKTVIGNPTNLQLSIGTVSCWIKASNSGTGHRCIFSKVDAYGLYLVDGVLLLYNWGSFGGSGNKSTSVNLNDGIYHHVALVFESGTGQNYIYIDGILKLTFSMSVLNQTSNFQIGSSANSTTQNINAFIDELSIYNAKLSFNQIQLLYNSGVGITL